MADYSGQQFSINLPKKQQNRQEIYIMRAFNFLLFNYIYWASPNKPDYLAILSGFNKAFLNDIIVFKKEIKK